MPGAEGAEVQASSQEHCVVQNTHVCPPWGNFLTIHDDIIGDAELGVHQRGLFFAPPRPAASGPGLGVGLDHEGFLTLPPLLLLQQRPLLGRGGKPRLKVRN